MAPPQPLRCLHPCWEQQERWKLFTGGQSLGWGWCGLFLESCWHGAGVRCRVKLLTDPDTTASETCQGKGGMMASHATAFSQIQLHFGLVWFFLRGVGLRGLTMGGLSLYVFFLTPRVTAQQSLKYGLVSSQTKDFGIVSRSTQTNKWTQVDLKFGQEIWGGGGCCSLFSFLGAVGRRVLFFVCVFCFFFLFKHSHCTTAGVSVPNCHWLDHFESLYRPELPKQTLSDQPSCLQQPAARTCKIPESLKPTTL